jgi:hypothetical protein
MSDATRPDGPGQTSWDDEPTAVRDEQAAPQSPPGDTPHPGPDELPRVGGDEDTTAVRSPLVEEPKVPMERTVRLRPEMIERRALPFKKQAQGRRAADQDPLPIGPNESLTSEVVPDHLIRPALPFDSQYPPAATQESVWSRDAVIDPRDLPSSLAPKDLDLLSSYPPPNDPGKAVAVLVIVSISVIVGLVALALFVLR